MSERTYETINIGSLGELADERTGRQFAAVLRDTIAAIQDPERQRDGRGWAKGTITITVSLEGRTEEDGGSLLLAAEVKGKSPAYRAAATAVQMVGGEPAIDVTESAQMPLVPVDGGVR